MGSNGDTKRKFSVGSEKIRGLGSFHKSLPHNEYGEVIEKDFETLVAATNGTKKFSEVEKGPGMPGEETAPFVNPQAGLAKDRLTNAPRKFEMPPAPKVDSVTAAAEMTELYWMALLRDVSFDAFDSDPMVGKAAAEIDAKFKLAVADTSDSGRLRPGIDIPGSAAAATPIGRGNLFRLGLPGETVGPLISQFFVRRINFGTQTIDQQERPYKTGLNFLTSFPSWLHAQNTGNGDDLVDYRKSNEQKAAYYEGEDRYISTPRDLARFVNKDALHQAYFNATLLLLSGGAKWPEEGRLPQTGRDSRRQDPCGREAGVVGRERALAAPEVDAVRCIEERSSPPLARGRRDRSA